MKLVRFGEEYYAEKLYPTDPQLVNSLALAATSWEALSGAGEVPKSNTACRAEALL